MNSHFANHLKVLSVWIIKKFYPEHNSDTAMLYAKYQNDTVNVINNYYGVTRFH